MKIQPPQFSLFYPLHITEEIYFSYISFFMVAGQRLHPVKDGTRSKTFTLAQSHKTQPLTGIGRCEKQGQLALVCISCLHVCTYT